MNLTQRPRTFAFAYFAVLLIFAGIYYCMPDEDFYHQSIKYEPTSVAHLEALKSALNEALQMRFFGTGPYGLSVDFTPVRDLAFPAKNTVTFTVGYFYYKLNATDLEWPVLTSHCGPSEKQRNFYERSLSYRIITAASYGGSSITIRSETPQVSECDRAILQLHYRSVEKTSEGFQAMVSIKPELNSLIEAVSAEQLGYAPRAFRWDRFSRMFYFSVSAMTTTGFGDILPLTTSARLLASGQAIVGIIVAGFFLNAVASPLRKRGSTNRP